MIQVHELEALLDSFGKRLVIGRGLIHMGSARGWLAGRVYTFARVVIYVCEMNAFIDNAERTVKEGARNVMTSKIALSAILVILAVALLRAFQLPTKILLRGAIILFIANYAVLYLSQEYISSGRVYRDFLFNQPVAHNKKFEPVLLVS